MEKDTTLELRWNKRAYADTSRISQYIGARNATAAHELLDEIDKRVESLLTNPMMGRKGRVTNTRELVVSENYIVVYRANSKKVVVLRVLHAKQKWP